jgi:hypothetical protein
MNNGLVNHTEAEGTVRGPRSEVRGFMIILIMKKGKGRGLRRDPRPRSPPRSESESGNKRTKLGVSTAVHATLAQPAAGADALHEGSARAGRPGIR